MQFINTQYKVMEISNEDRYGSTAVVLDTLKGQMVKNLRIINYQKETQAFIEYMKLNMFNYRNLKHPNLINFYFFNSMLEIDAKPVVANKYYYTYENFKGIGLFEFARNKDFDIRLELTVQLCSLIKYLHLRGFLLYSVGARELYVIDEKGKPQIKVAKLPYIEGVDRSVVFDNVNNYFKAPEAFQFGDYSKASDIYLIGSLMFYIFSGINVEGSNFKDDLERFGRSGDVRKAAIAEIIRKCTALKPENRYASVEKIVEDINERLAKSFNIIDKKLIQRLPRNMTSLVSRENFFQKIISSAKGFLYDNKPSPRVMLVKGGIGTGKSVFMKAAAYRLEQEGITVCFNNLNEDQSCSFYCIIMLIKDMMKTADKEVVEKYIADISYIIPEINNGPEAPLYISTIKQEDKIRLIYRLGNFILEASLKGSVVIAINGFEYIDEDSLRVLSYIVRNEGKGKRYFLLGFGLQNAEESTRFKELYDSLNNIGYIDTIELNNLNINETAEYVRLLLGMEKPCLDFSAKVFKETEGNPRFIYEVIYFLVINNHIYVNDKGEWVLEEVDFNALNLSFNIDVLVLEQINKLNSAQKKIIEAMSIFNTAVSPDTLAKLLEMDREMLEESLIQLDSLNILSKKVDDWGISYDFSSINLKRSIYEQLPQETRQKYHLSASYILEEKFLRENRENKDELIFHMSKAMRFKEAIEYLVNASMNMISSNLVNQAIQFLEQSYAMFDKVDSSREKLIVCSKLGELYEQIGEYTKSTYFYGEVEKAAICSGDTKALIDIYIKLFSLSYKLDDKKNAIKCVSRAKLLLKKVSYPEGLYEMVISLNEIMSNKRKYSSYINILESIMKVIDKEQNEIYYARFLVIYGRIICNRNRYAEGLEMLLSGMEIFERLSEYKYMPFILNAIGYVYSEYYNDMQKSREYYEKCLSVSQKLNNLSSMEKSYNNLAEIY
ncbi:MAG: protein kinase, partial [Pseudomonadota bacterium]